MNNQYLEGLKIYKKTACPIQNEPLSNVCESEEIKQYGLTTKLRKQELFYRDFFYAAIDNETAYHDFVSMKTPTLYGIPEADEPDYKKLNTHLTESSMFVPHYNVSKCLHYRYDVPYFHDHEFYEFTLCMAGSACIENSGECYMLRRGSISLTPPNVKHRVCVLDDNTLVTNILVRASTFSQVFPFILSRGSLISSFFTNAEYGEGNYKFIIFSMSHDDFLLNLIHMLLGNIDSLATSVIDSVMRTFLEYLLTMDENAFQTSRFFSVNRSGIVSKVMRYISENYRDISLNMVADHFNYSPQHMSRLIKHETNRSFTDIVQNYKLTAACELLKSTSIKIGEISDICGFANREHFTRLFNKVYGISPSMYRIDKEN